MRVTGPPHTGLLIGLLLGCFLLGAGPLDPESRLLDLQDQIRGLESRLEALYREEEQLLQKQEALAQEVRQLKREEGGPWQEIRLQWRLRALRDTVEALFQVEKQEKALQDQLQGLRKQLRGTYLESMERRRQAAEAAVRTGHMRDAEAHYRKILEWMEALQQLNQQFPYPHLEADLGDLDFPLTGAESSEQLQELALLFRTQVARLESEIHELELTRDQLEQELRLREHLLRFQGVVERVNEGGGHPLERSGNLQREIHRQKIRLEGIRLRLQQLRELRAHLLKRARQAEDRAAQLEEERLR